MNQVYYYELVENSTEKIELWKIESQNLEYIAGFMALGLTVVEYPYKLESDTELGDFLIYKDIDPDKTSRYLPDKYGIWIKSYDSNFYNLYGFNDTIFLNGLLDFAKSAKIDVNNYILDKIIDAKGKKYNFNSKTIYSDFSIVEDTDDYDYLNDREEADENNQEGVDYDDYQRTFTNPDTVYD